MNDKIKLTVRSVTFNLDKNNSWLITVSDSFHKRVSYIVNGHLSEMALAMHTAQWLWFLQWLLLFNSMEGGKIIFFLRYIFFFQRNNNCWRFFYFQSKITFTQRLNAPISDQCNWWLTFKLQETLIDDLFSLKLQETFIDDLFIFFL